jgi:regulatory protein
MRRKPANPIEPCDARRLEALAIHYVARYATTEMRLRNYLRRKQESMGDDAVDMPLTETIVQKMVALGFVDDSSFAESRAATLFRRGYGARRVNAALHQAGIVGDTAQAAVLATPVSSRAAVEIYAQRRKIGPFSGLSPTKEVRQKAIAKLMRAGHDYDDVMDVLADWR